MAQIHGLINNCLGCGRVVCEQEGEGPCCFCGNTVLKQENMDELVEADRIMKEMEDDPSLSQTYYVAVEHKAKLLNQDRDKGSIKNKIDDDADWYEVKNDVWQDSSKRKEALQRMVHKDAEEERARNEEYMAFDFGTGKVHSEKVKVDDEKDKKLIAEMLASDLQEATLEDKMMKVEADRRLREKDQILLQSIAETYHDKVVKSEQKKGDDKSEVKKSYALGKLNTKVVDNDDCYDQFLSAIAKANEDTAEKEQFDRIFYRLTADDNQCLSMYQPWASLLIYGFKRFEGRLWDTDYRGPLWIHAGAKEPTPELIKSIEDQYRKLYQGVDIPPFPQTYPTGCIIGVCDLQDVIDQKVYKEYIPKRYTGESTEEHLFVVRNPRRLMVNIRCVGNKGIFPLNEQMVSTAIHTLKRVPTGWFPYYADNLPVQKPKDITKAVEEEEPSLTPSAKNTAKDAKTPDASNTKISAANQSSIGGTGSASKSQSTVITKSLEFVENCDGGAKFFRLGKVLEPKFEEFAQLFEKAFSKKIEKGSAGFLNNQIVSYLPGFEQIKEVLVSIMVDVYRLSPQDAEASMPKKVDLFAVTKISKKFDLPRAYYMMITVGRKLEMGFSNAQSRPVYFASGNLLVSGNSQQALGSMYFSKVPKSNTLEGMNCVSGESLVFCFY